MFFSQFLRSWRRGAKPSDLRLVIDIGSLSIKTVLYRKKGDTVEIIRRLASRFPQRKDALGAVSFINQYLRETIFGFIKELRVMPDQVLVGFSSDFILSAVDTLRVERPNRNKRISEDELVMLYKKGVEALMKKDEKYVLVDSFPLVITVDGYEIFDTKEAVRGSEIEIKTFGLFMAHEYWEQFRHLHKILGGLNVKYISNQLVNALSLPKLLGVDTGFFIDIGGMATEITFLDRGKIAFIDRIHYGGDSATQELLAMRNGYMEAETLKRQYSDGIAPEMLRGRIGDACKKVAAEWRAKFLGSLSANFGFIASDKIFVFGGGAALPEMRAELMDQSLFKDFAFSDNVSVVFLETEKITPPEFPGEKLTSSSEITLVSLMIHSLAGATLHR